ncbi:MAG: T9SS type A sorting domain-containing protein [Saprospiraceae bacterium]|nr:T9SS type A sorting domain-containing protein [Saprospiraceae bacterium]MBK7809726.1 T9SS type A sorting domain-containing protein [Saprospiraceae bacterium]MBK9632164.1 T9SS type A sorting domain-containing protein [Saprospiraceae bacterium]
MFNSLLLMACFNLSSQKVEWVDFFEGGTDANHIMRINDSLLVVACDRDLDHAKAYLYNLNGQRLDSITFDSTFVSTVKLVSKLNNDSLIFILNYGIAIITTIDLKNPRYIKLNTGTIYRILRNSNGFYFFSSNPNKPRNYINLYLNNNLQIVKRDSTDLFDTFEILFLYDNKDYITSELVNGTNNLIKRDSLDQIIWQTEINNSITIRKIFILQNQDLIFLGTSQKINEKNKNMVVVRINPEGDILWEKYFEPRRKSKDYDSYRIGISLVELENSNICITGTDGYSPIGPITLHMVTTLNKHGELVWEYYGQFCGEGEGFNDLFADSSNNLYISGFACAADFWGSSVGILLKLSPPFINSLDIILNKFSIIPNPAQENIVIDIDPSITIKNMNIYNINGVKVNTPLVTSNNIIDVSNFTTGIYFCELTLVDGSKYRSRFVKQ